MKRHLLLLGFLFAALALQAQQAPVPLGELKVNFRAEADTLKVGVDQGPFQALRFEVEGNDLELFNVTVTYGVGRDDSLEVRHRFQEGSRSRDISLKGNDRFIRKITFQYKTTGKLRDGRATLKVYGLY